MGSVQLLTEVVRDTAHVPWSHSRTYRTYHDSNQTESPSLRRTASMSHSGPSQTAPAQASPTTSATFRTRPEATKSASYHDKAQDMAASIVGAAPATSHTFAAQEEPPPPPYSEKAAHNSSTVPSSAHADSDNISSESSSRQSPSAPRIKVRDLQHIQSYDDQALGRIASSRPPSPGADVESEAPPQYEISDMPVSDVIEMVAGLLTKITTTNDTQHEHLHRQLPTAESAMSLSQQTASVLAFHGKNVPNITIMSYLTRIHKYCPATFEVFLSLLVYFDRMTDKVNSVPLQNLRQSHDQMQGMDEKRGEYAEKEQSSGLPSPPLSDSDPSHLQHLFVVDSYNIHRLVIAGVTCASKFFSDIFYTNSRYAKVGGLPLAELNHLELQFLLLNDFRLSISTEELEAYATMLVEFYAREIVEQRKEEAAAAAAATAHTE